MSYFLRAGWSRGVDATLHQEGGSNARETEETEAGAARVHGGGAGQGVGSLGRRESSMRYYADEDNLVLVSRFGSGQEAR